MHAWPWCRGGAAVLPIGSAGGDAAELHVGSAGGEHWWWLQVFEKGNFAGLDEMKRNPRLFERVAPMGVTDIIMAVSYSHTPRSPLPVPITAFDGLRDYTIAPGNVGQWAGCTSAAFRNVPILGDHYFVASHHRQVCTLSLLTSHALYSQDEAGPVHTSANSMPSAELPYVRAAQQLQASTLLILEVCSNVREACAALISMHKA